MTLGFFGFGEAGFNMAAGLREAGHPEIVVYDLAGNAPEGDPRRQLFDERIAGSRARPVADAAALAQTATTILLAVPAQHSEAAVETLLTEGRIGPDHRLIDVCASSAQLKELLGRRIADKGVAYADAAMLGPLTVHRHKVPIVVSGPAAAAWCDEMRPYGMDLTLMEGAPGLASRIKLSRSLFIKSFEALLVETFQTARRNGIEEILMESLSGTFDGVPFRKTAQRYMAGDLIHAARRAHELEDAIDLMRESGTVPLVASGALERLRTNAALGTDTALGGRVPDTLDAIYAAWRDAGAV